MTSFAELTTLRVGGPIPRLVTVASDEQLLSAAATLWNDEWLVLGGGSNLLASDDPYPGVVVQLATRGITHCEPDATDDTGLTPSAAGVGGADSNAVGVRIAAGESWDVCVSWAIERGYAGLEALSGIPGLVGAAPVQNIGAYGQELGEVLTGIEFLPEGSDAIVSMSAEELGLGYRTSTLKRGLRGIVTAIRVRLHDTASERSVLGTALGRPIMYAPLADRLGVQLGDRAALTTVRAAVLDLRAERGMLLNPHDPDTASAGSFFTNPIVSEHVARQLPAEAPRWSITPDTPDEIIPLTEAESPLAGFLAYRADLDAGTGGYGTAALMPQDPAMKVSAAWLIEHAGIHRGFSLPGSRAAISTKHTLALTNRGGATTDEVAQLARYVAARVTGRFGISLYPEPTLLGVDW